MGVQRAATSLALLWISVAISGCVSHSGIHGREHETSAHELAFENDTASDGVFVTGDWPDADWWSMFGDPRLDALISQALVDNPTLHAAEARVRAAHSLARAAHSSLLPTLDANATAGRERLSEHDLIYGPIGGSTINQGRIALDFSYDFDFWSKYRDTFAAALGEARAVEADSAATRLVLASAVAQTYFQLQTDIAIAEVAKQTLAQREGLRDLNRQRSSRGLDTTIPSRQSDQQVSSSRVAVAAAVAAMQLDRHQLAALVGLGPDAVLDVQPTLQTYENMIALPTDLPANLLARRPDVAAQRFRAEAAAARIGVAKADFYPNVNLAAFVGLDALTLHSLHLFDAGSRVAGVSAAINLPLFEAGRLQAILQGRYDEYDLAIAQYNQTLINALRQVADRIVDLRSVRRQLIDQVDARNAAADAYRLTLDRYRAGLTNYLDVLVNEERLLAERQKQAQLQGKSLTLAVELMWALGGGYRAPTFDAGS